MNNNKPDLTLNMDDKIYLAVTKDTTGKLAFVYTLACLKQNQHTNSYNLLPSREIHTFSDTHNAEMYCETINKIIEQNAKDKNKQVFFNTNEKVIENFLENFENCR